MMKKVLYGVALTLLASVSVGSLQSCKDDVNDLRTQTSYDLGKLKSQINDELEALKRKVDTNTSDIASIQGDIANIKRDYATLQYVNDEIARVEADYKEADKALLAKIEGAIETLTDHGNRITALEELTKDYDKLADKEWVANEIKGASDALQAQIDALKDYVDGQDEEIYGFIREVQEQMTQMMNALQTYTDEQIAELREEMEQEIDAIYRALDVITERMDKFVTGILIQGVYSPVFGDFSLPIGVRSNILFNWYGENKRGMDVKFPSNDFNVNGNPGLPSTVAPAEYFTAPEGLYGNVADGKMSLGKVYVTINPISAQLDNLNVYLQTSAGTTLPWAVTLEPSDYELTFGYTRSVENGFYEGEVVAPVEDVKDNVEVVIEEGLKTAMKDALKNPSMTTAKELVKAVYDQLSGKIPAYALYYKTGAAEEVDPGFSVGTQSPSVAVLSQYDLAVATSKPLSYNFLADYPGASKQLPTIGHIQNLISKIRESGALKFELNDINVGDIEINWDEIDFSSTEEDAALTITIPNIQVVESPNTTPTTKTIVLSTLVQRENETEAQFMERILGKENYHPSTTKYEFSAITGLDDIENGIIGGIKKGVNGVSTQITDQIKEQIDGVISKINEEIGAKVNSLLDKAENKLEPYFGKINKAFDIYNKVANKVNNFLKNPNAYLQVAAYYKMGNSYGIASGVKADPTPVVGKGDFTIYLSSYTGELIVPACKKYVAITGAPEGVQLASVNSGDLNKVLDGNQIEVNVSGLTKAGVYEFTYQALDYNGYTSTKKFYIEVK